MSRQNQGWGFEETNRTVRFVEFLGGRVGMEMEGLGLWGKNREGLVDWMELHSSCWKNPQGLGVGLRWNQLLGGGEGGGRGLE